MTRWDAIEKLIEDGKQPEIKRKSIKTDLVRGTYFYDPKRPPCGGVVLVHGVADNRFTLGVLAERLAMCRYWCLSIDLPMHFLNKEEFSLGLASETIQEAVQLVKEKVNGMKVGVIGHSLGSLATIFAAMRYTSQIEENLCEQWEELNELLEKRTNLWQHWEKLGTLEEMATKKPLKELDALITQKYRSIRTLLFNTLQDSSDIDAIVLCAPPTRLKTAMPGTKLLRMLHPVVQKSLIDTFFHRPQIKKVKEADNPVHYKDKPSDEFQWQFLKTDDLDKFLDYVIKVGEPFDYIQLLEVIAQLPERNTEAEFIVDYVRKVKALPKLFIYGKKDQFLKSFFPWNIRRIESCYKSYGNAGIVKGDFGHLLNDTALPLKAAQKIKGRIPTMFILDFLDQYVGS